MRPTAYSKKGTPLSLSRRRSPGQVQMAAISLPWPPARRLPKLQAVREIIALSRASSAAPRFRQKIHRSPSKEQQQQQDGAAQEQGGNHAESSVI